MLLCRVAAPQQRVHLIHKHHAGRQLGSQGEDSPESVHRGRGHGEGEGHEGRGGQLRDALGLAVVCSSAAMQQGRRQALPDQLDRLAKPLAGYRRGGDGKKCSSALGSSSACQQRLAGAWGPKQEHPLAGAGQSAACGRRARKGGGRACEQEAQAGRRAGCAGARAAPPRHLPLPAPSLLPAPPATHLQTAVGAAEGAAPPPSARACPPPERPPAQTLGRSPQAPAPATGARPGAVGGGRGGGVRR